MPSLWNALRTQEWEQKMHELAVRGALLFFSLLTAGCVSGVISDDFHEHRPTGSVSKKGAYVPDGYISKNKTRIPLILAWIDIQKLPHTYVMNLGDGTIVERDKGFRAFVLEEMYIEFADGTRIDCIDPRSAKSARTFRLHGGPDFWLESKKFEGVITRRENFNLHLSGYSIRTNGSRVPFKNATLFEYEGKKTHFQTWYQRWAAI